MHILICFLLWTDLIKIIECILNWFLINYKNWKRSENEGLEMIKLREDIESKYLAYFKLYGRVNYLYYRTVERLYQL